MTESGLPASGANAPLVTARTVMVWRVLISSASLVWERYVLNWEYSGWLESTSVMLVAVTVRERVRRETRERKEMRVGRDIGIGGDENRPIGFERDLLCKMWSCNNGG